MTNYPKVIPVTIGFTKDFSIGELMILESKTYEKLFEYLKGSFRVDETGNFVNLDTDLTLGSRWRVDENSNPAELLELSIVPTPKATIKFRDGSIRYVDHDAVLSERYGDLKDFVSRYSTIDSERMKNEAFVNIMFKSMMLTIEILLRILERLKR